MTAEAPQCMACPKPATGLVLGRCIAGRVRFVAPSCDDCKDRLTWATIPDPPTGLPN